LRSKWDRTIIPRQGACRTAAKVESVADIFISYTSTDRDWAFWIAKELEALGHTPHIHEFEVNAGDDIYKWMDTNTDRV
jgi:hypothetical protein